MRIIDIRTKQIDEHHALKDSHARFQVDVRQITKQEWKKTPHFELELGKKEEKGWFNGWKHLGFSFTTEFGLKKYRIHTWFLLSCFLLFVAVSGLSFVGKAYELKDALMEKGKAVLQDASASNLFAASLAVKETNKSLASLGEIPRSFSEKLQALNFGSAWAEFFLRTTGYYNPRSYLIVFQNNAEMRATGGFMGTYALISADQGNVEIKKMEGIYHASGQQHISVVPPLPIQKVSPSWMFHDANWFFHFPTSAKAISWFYEKTGGPTVDGVIALTPEVISRLLHLVGPIELPEFQTTITADNFIDIIQYEVEIRYKERGFKDPKKILADLAPLFLQKIVETDKDMLFAALLDSLAQKEVLFYFDRPEEEAFIEYLRWGGTLASTERDYLAVVNTNVNGFKTDRMITQDVTHQSSIQADGGVVDTVTITRVHRGGNQEQDWYNKVNSNFMRVYVPRGATLLKAQGHTKETNPFLASADSIHYPALQKTMETATIDPATGTLIWEEDGKTVFGNWVYVSPGEATTVTYQYKLPFTVSFDDPEPFSLTIQKQPGITYGFAHELVVNGGQIAWRNFTPATLEPLKKDAVYVSILSR